LEFVDWTQVPVGPIYYMTWKIIMQENISSCP
jgi:hypothetical protein